MNNYTNKLIQKLIEAGVTDSDSIKPCTKEEIEKIESTFSVTLPQSYKQFLTAMGSGAGKFMRGIDFYYPLNLRFRDYAESVLDRWDNPYTLTKTDFVFLTHGPQFMFFDTSASDDPPVIYYKEAEYKVKETNPSFSNWLECRVDEALMYRARKLKREQNRAQ